MDARPLREDHGRTFAFAGGTEARGNARKVSGSYYTPDSLVEALLDTALDPVLDRAEAQGGADAILSLNVIDPACGSGHFLLGAARRMATRVAQLRDNDDPDYPAAMRDVARNCIHGVDRNPMAVELAKVALWIETVEPGKPLGFLDANIQCGDSLLGVFDLQALDEGIPDEAYKPLTGDDNETAKWFAKRNKAEKIGQGSFDWAHGSGRLPPAKLAADMVDLRHLPEDTVEQVEAKRQRFAAWTNNPKRWATRVACDLYIAAFLLPKRGGVPANANSAMIPTTAHVRTRLGGGGIYGPLEAAAIEAAQCARAFHWPLAFPEVMLTRGGFDIVLGNPPWDVLQLEEQHFFQGLAPHIASVVGEARKVAIQKLADDAPEIFRQYEVALRSVEALSQWIRASQRFRLSAVGRLNAYALFAELALSATRTGGRVGLITPAEIVSSESIKAFFQYIVGQELLRSVFGFENEEFIFPGIANVNKFALVTLSRTPREKTSLEFAFYLRKIGDLADPERSFTLTKSEFIDLNPNTGTCPTFRSREDARLTKDISRRVPVFVDERPGEETNVWDVRFAAMFNITTSSGLFVGAKAIRDADRANSFDSKSEFWPLYEGKFVWHYDHRFSSYHNLGRAKGRGGRGLPPVTREEHADPLFSITPRHWVRRAAVEQRLSELEWKKEWLVGWRDVSNAKVERTMVPCIFPRTGVADTLPLLFCDKDIELICALVANLSSLTLDYIARQKTSGSHLTQMNLLQFPVLPPSAYSHSDLEVIARKVLELTYTSHTLAPFASDLGFVGPPFAWDENRRSYLRADLDAWYALAYGLSRDELRYVLDPKEVKGANYPSETYRVLQKNEIANFAEYRTARLVMGAYDQFVSEGMRPRTEGYR